MQINTTHICSEPRKENRYVGQWAPAWFKCYWSAPLSCIVITVTVDSSLAPLEQHRGGCLRTARIPSGTELGPVRERCLEREWEMPLPCPIISTSWYFTGFVCWIAKHLEGNAEGISLLDGYFSRFFFTCINLIFKNLFTPFLCVLWAWVGGLTSEQRVWID